MLTVVRQAVPPILADVDRPRIGGGSGRPALAGAAGPPARSSARSRSNPIRQRFLRRLIGISSPTRLGGAAHHSYETMNSPHSSPPSFRTMPLFAVLLVGVTGSAVAATFYVDSNQDQGQGSYRDAIELANLSPGPHKIYFEEIPGGVITIREPVPVISSSVELIGLGATRTVLDGEGIHRVMAINPSQPIIVSLSNLTLRNGTNEAGGCLYASRVTLSLERVRVTGCSGRFGGGIYVINQSVLEIINSRIDHNSATYTGAGLSTYNIPVRIVSSEIDHNVLAGGGYISGGGVSISDGPFAQIIKSYFHHNSSQTTDVGAPGSGSTGGGLFTSALDTTVEDSTFSSNSAMYGAGVAQTGIPTNPLKTWIIGSTFARNSGRSSLQALVGTTYLGFSTVTDSRPRQGESSGSAVSSFSSVVMQLEGNVLAGNFPGGSGLDLDTGGRAAVAARNYIGRAGAGSVDPESPGNNVFGNAPKLGPLRWQGGRTPTMQPLPDSPLVDLGNPSGTPLRDQRGFKRIVGLAADIGAVEYDPDRISFGYFETDPIEE